MTDALLLDFDGTLVHFDRETALERAAAAGGLETSPVAVADLVAADRRRARGGDHDRLAWFESLAPDHGPAMHDAFWEAVVDRTRAVAGAEALLDHCARAGIRTALVTDWDGLPDLKARRLEACALVARFDAVVIGGEGHLPPKPSIEPFRSALERLDIAAEDALMVGDKVEADLVPAVKLGMRAVWRRADYPGDWKPAVDRLDEVIEWL